MSEFLKRTISGVLFVVVIVGAILIGHITFFVVFLALMVACMYEFYMLGLKARTKPQTMLGISIGIALYVWSFLYTSGKVEQITLFGFIPLFSGIFLVELYRAQPRPILNIAYTILGIFYIALPFSLLNFIVINGSSFKMTYDPKVLLGILFLIWSNDTGAYLTGMSIGNHKMAPRISPKKSWEGFWGGIIFTIFVSWIIAAYFTEVSFKHWFVIGIISALMSVFGDLVESMFKRSVGVKDSGKFLPGHGGLLDRFDSPIMAIPVVYAYLEVMMII